MKTRINVVLLLLSVALCRNSMAELTFVEAKREEVTSKAFGQANVGKDTVQKEKK